MHRVFRHRQRPGGNGQKQERRSHNGKRNLHEHRPEAPLLDRRGRHNKRPGYGQQRGNGKQVVRERRLLMHDPAHEAERATDDHGKDMIARVLPFTRLVPLPAFLSCS